MRSLLFVIPIAFATALPLRGQVAAIRDSAGIRIVENPLRSKAGLQWHLGPPSAELGGTDKPLDAQLFTAKSEYGLLAFARLRDGRILVADSWQEGGSGQPITKTWLKYFSFSGGLIKVVKLDDNGEPFAGVGQICQSRGDTVWIAGKTIGVLDGTGRVIRRFDKDFPGGSGFRGSACFDDGSVLMPFRDSATLPDFSNPNPTLTFIARRTDGSLAHDFGAQPDISPLPSGPGPSVVAMGGSLIVAPARTSEVRMYDLSNRLTRIIRWADQPVPVTLTEIAASVGRARASDENGQLPVRNDPYTSNWGAYLRVLTDPIGRIWVEDEDHSAERGAALMSVGWTAFDSTGQMVGRLVLPKAEDGERRYSIQFGKDEVLLFHLNWKTKTGAKVTAYPLVPSTRRP